MVDFGDEEHEDPARVEVTPYLGWNFALAENWRLDTALSRYIYDGEIFGQSIDYSELNTLLHYGDLATARFAVAFDAYGRGGEIFDYEFQARYPLTDSLELSASLGYEDADAVFGYDELYWSLGATWFFHKHASIDVRYYDFHHFADVVSSPDLADSFELPHIEKPIAVSISIGF